MDCVWAKTTILVQYECGIRVHQLIERFTLLSVMAKREQQGSINEYIYCTNNICAHVHKYAVLPLSRSKMRKIDMYHQVFVHISTYSASTIQLLHIQCRMSAESRISVPIMYLQVCTET